jgi:hypothetical protein
MAPKAHHKILEELDRRALDGGKAEKLALGHEKLRLGLVDSGLRDMLEAFGKLASGDTTTTGLDKAFGTTAALTNARDWATPLPSGQGAAALSEDAGDLARLGEGLRVYARDEQLSRPLDAQLVVTLRSSVACFDKALDRTDDSERRAWLLAHRGAARSMIYWYLLTSSSDPAEHDTLFAACTKDFEEACALKDPYPWSHQFLAFLYALRGTQTPGKDGAPAVDDFDRAIELLKELPEEARPGAIQRHIGMLSSYNAVGTGIKRKSPADRIKAACESIDRGLEAVECDQDEFFGAYSAAVSYWARYETSKETEEDAKRRVETATGGASTDEAAAARAALGEAEAETARLRRLTKGALDAARTRARNAISQALAAAVGLSFLRARLAWEDDKADNSNGGHLDAAVRESTRLLQFFDLVQPDLETRSIFIRDPAWQAILSHEVCRKAFADIGYDRLRQIDYWSPDNMKTRRAAIR